MVAQIKVINKVNEKTVASCYIGDLCYEWDEEDSIVACCGDPVSKEWFIATKEGAMFSITLVDEDRDMWFVRQSRR